LRPYDPGYMLFVALNNLFVLAMLYLYGFGFGAPTAKLLFLNGFSIGMIAAQYPLGKAIIGLLPHGALEVPALILAATCGFKIGATEILVVKRRSKQAFKELLEAVKSTWRLMLLAVALTLTGAFIEVYVTPRILGRILY